MATIKCEHCYTGFDYNIRTEGYFLWKKKIEEYPICPHCKKENHSERRIICLNCGEANMYSILDGTNGLHCISCNEPLPAITTIHLECPKCSLETDVDINVENYACRGNDGTCSEIINIRSEVDWKKTYAQQGAVIRSSTPENYIIWKDKRHHFPYTSRMIVGESKEYALIEKNGKLACYKHEDSDFENGFLLGDTLKSRGIRLREAAENDEVSTFWIDIYWVSRQTISINKDWRDVIDLFIQGDCIEARIRSTDADKPANAIAEMVACLKFGLQIIDAKAFYKKIQQDSLTRDQLVNLTIPDGYGQILRHLMMDSVCKCLNKHFDPELPLGFEYQKFKSAVKEAINSDLVSADDNWGLQVADFHFDSILTWNEEKKSALNNSGLIRGEIEDDATIADLLAAIKKNHEAVEAIKEAAEKNHGDLKEAIQKNHHEAMDGLKQVNAVGKAIEGKLDGVITEIRNELSSIENEARTLGIIGTEMSDQLADFQRAENAGLEELRDLEGMVNNLRKAFLVYKETSTEQKKASIDRLVQKLENQQKAVIGRINELEKELLQCANAFWSKLDEFFHSGKEGLSQFLADFKDRLQIIHDQAIDLNKILNTTIVTEEQCKYMEFNDVSMFRSFIKDSQIKNDDLERVIAVAFNLAQTGKLDISNDLDLGNYSPYTFMMGYLYEKLVKRYYHGNVFLPFIQGYNSDYYDDIYIKNNTKKLRNEGKPWYPDLGHYSSGPWPSFRNWCSRRDKDGNYYPDESTARAFSEKFLLSGSDYSTPQWMKLLRNMVQANAFRNAAAHVSSPITKTEAIDFFTLMFKGQDSLLRRLIMMRDVTVKEPEVTVSAE